MSMPELSSNWKKLQATLKPASGDGRSSTDKPENAHGYVASQVHQRQKPLKLPPAKKRKLYHRPAIQSEKSRPNGHGREWERAPSAVRRANRRSKPLASKMGILSSRPIEGSVDTNEHAESKNGAPPTSTAIEDILYSQRSLASKPSSTSLVNHTDTINSGIVAGVVAGKYVALDCEMVGVGPDPNARSMLARVSLVNFYGEQVYDAFVTAKEEVTDYRTAVSGITEKLLRECGRPFEVVQAEVAELLQSRVLVGHAVRHDLDVLLLGHPRRDIRDTSRHRSYREIAGGRTPALKRLARELLGVEIQGGAHSSIEDARATMMLYKREKAAFEQENIRKHGLDRRHIRPQPIDGEIMAVKEKAREKGDRKKRKRKR